MTPILAALSVILALAALAEAAAAALRWLWRGR